MATKKVTTKKPTAKKVVSIDQTIVDNLANGKDAAIIALVQKHAMSLGKAAVEYRKYAVAHGLDDKKDSMSQKLIDWFLEDTTVEGPAIQKYGEEIGMAKSSVHYYKTMLLLAKNVAEKL